ncbi:MAG: hypothetical protein ACE5F8_01825 [Woeseiaceae bacterium]
MSRSPLAYPLNRGVDSDSGGTADLQTDIMRFMAILALCLVAIFALVQSLPMQATASPEPVPVVEATPPMHEEPEPVLPPQPQQQTNAAAEPETVSLTRPKWVSTFEPRQPVHEPVEQSVEQTVESAPPPGPTTTVPDPAPPAPAKQGFTLRFESDLALTRLVASGQVGFYAIDGGRTQRMSVADSRISFWEASTPNSFHEMEALTVPRPVVDALARTGANTISVDWGVTLPGKLSRQLDSLLREHSGGSLVIRADGNLDLENAS